MECFNEPSRGSSKRNHIGKDTQLWLPQGNCLVYLYNENQSFRGAAFKLPYDVIHSTGSKVLMAMCCRADESISCAPTSSSLPGEQYRIYIPAPQDISREQSYQYHCTTRNFFRFLLGKPLMASDMGLALVALSKRITEWTTPRSFEQSTIVQYMDLHGYSKFAENPANALAALLVAERFQLTRLWNDAFAHCVGMGQRAVECYMFRRQSLKTQRLLRRSQRDLLTQVGPAILFLRDFDTLPLNLHSNLSPAQCSYLMRLASFFQDTFVDSDSTDEDPGIVFDRAHYLSMREEFQNLYHYLSNADSDSDPDSMSAASFDEQEIRTCFDLFSFNAEKGYKAMESTLPILPGGPQKPTPQKRLSRTLSNIMTVLPSSTKHTTMIRDTTVLKELLEANINDKERRHSISPSSLTSKFILFELETLLKGDGLDMREGRLLGWTVIYSALQTLIWVTSAHGVQDSSVTYPLCCSTAGIPPWKSPATVLPFAEINVHASGIQHSRRVSTASHAVSTPQSKCDTELSSEIPNDFIPSRVGSLRRRLSITPRRLSQPPTLVAPVYHNSKHVHRRNSSYQEIIIPGYGNGSSHTYTDNSPTNLIPQTTSQQPAQPQVCYSPSIYSSDWASIKSLNMASLPRRNASIRSSSSVSTSDTVESSDTVVSTMPSLCESVTSTSESDWESPLSPCTDSGSESWNTRGHVNEDILLPKPLRPRTTLVAKMEVNATRQEISAPKALGIKHAGWGTIEEDIEQLLRC